MLRILRLTPSAVGVLSRIVQQAGKDGCSRIKPCMCSQGLAIRR
jgi:hypothetical protein